VTVNRYRNTDKSLVISLLQWAKATISFDHLQKNITNAKRTIRMYFVPAQEAQLLYSTDMWAKEIQKFISHK